MKPYGRRHPIAGGRGCKCEECAPSDRGKGAIRAEMRDELRILRRPTTTTEKETP